MPAYLLQLPEAVGSQRFASAQVIHAETPADAQAIAQSQFDGDGNTAWANATVTELAAVQADVVDSMAGWSFRVAVLDASPLIDVLAVGVLGAVSATIQAGGTGYADNDIVTLSGGTSARDATFKVTGQTGGVVDTVVPVDPGEYTAFPGDPVTTTGGTGTGLTLNVTSNNATLYNLVGEMVGLLNAQSQIANAGIDFSASPPLLTIAAVADNLGDKQLLVQMLPPPVGGVTIPSFIGTITDQGIAAAALTVELGSPPVKDVPQVYQTFL